MLTLVLDRHGVRIHCLLSCHALKAEEDASVVILVTLHDKSTLLLAVNPSDAYEVLL